MMMSDEVFMGFNSVRYVNHSYKAIGNDGTHFNQSINAGVNAAVPAHVANALFTVSDHLPVAMKLAVYAKLGVEEQGASNLMAYVTPNPASGSLRLSFQQPSDGNLHLELLTPQGQLVMAQDQFFPEGSNQYDLSLPNLRSGLYLLRLGASNGITQVLKVGVR